MERVGIIGLGYGGLPLAVAFAEVGLDVLAVDVDQRKIAAIEAGDSYIEDIPDERLKPGLEGIHPPHPFAAPTKATAAIICVRAPLTLNREPILGPLLDSGRALSAVLQEDQLVVLES